MKIWKNRWYILLLFLFIFPHLCNAQSRFRNKHLKYVDEGRHKAISSTLVPLALGIGTATFINNKTIQTTGSLMAFYGLILGPSVGNLYAHDYLRAMLGVVARVGGEYLMKDATREIFGHKVADAVGWDKKDVSLGNAKVLIGAGLILGSAIYNIISVKASVKRYNKALGYYIRPTPAYKKGHIVPMLSAYVTF